ncbi:MAG: shikimate kinase [Verrucomicrobiia bacterium]
MKVAIIGNSGSGKSTLARKLAANQDTCILDLDLIFWEKGTSVERPLRERVKDVEEFCGGHASWIIEGCYSDLIAASFAWVPELVFMDPGPEICLANCRRRPHERHKFRTKEEQDRQLEALLQWVADYYERDDLMSHRAHLALFEAYSGPKRRIQNQTPADDSFY